MRAPGARGWTRGVATLVALSMIATLVALSMIACHDAAPTAVRSPTGAGSATAVASSAPASFEGAGGGTLGGTLLPATPNATAIDAGPPPAGEGPACARTDDCWSWSCCTATARNECVHSSLAPRCAVIDVQCPALAATWFECVCEKGRCDGRVRSP